MNPNQEVLSRVLASSINAVEVPAVRGEVSSTFLEPYGGTVLTAQEIRAETARERREAVKARDLDRRTKRQNKRSQCF